MHWPTPNLLDFNWPCCLERFYMDKLYRGLKLLWPIKWRWERAHHEHSISHQLVKGLPVNSIPCFSIQWLELIRLQSGWSVRSSTPFNVTSMRRSKTVSLTENFGLISFGRCCYGQLDFQACLVFKLDQNFMLRQTLWRFLICQSTRQLMLELLTNFCVAQFFMKQNWHHTETMNTSHHKALHCTRL